MSGKTRTQQDWAMHHRLVGEIATRASMAVSNSQKMEYLAAMDEIDKRKKKEWAENAAQKRDAQKREPALTGPATWADLDLEEL